MSLYSTHHHAHGHGHEDVGPFHHHPRHLESHSFDAPSDAEVDLFLAAIAHEETRGEAHPYTAESHVDGSTACGRYQMNDGTWEDITGQDGRAKDASPQEQDAAAREHARDLWQHFGNEYDTARAWNQGTGGAESDPALGADYGANVVRDIQRERELQPQSQQQGPESSSFLSTALTNAFMMESATLTNISAGVDQLPFINGGDAAGGRSNNSFNGSAVIDMTNVGVMSEFGGVGNFGGGNGGVLSVMTTDLSSAFQALESSMATLSSSSAVEATQDATYSGHGHIGGHVGGHGSSGHGGNSNDGGVGNAAPTTTDDSSTYSYGRGSGGSDNGSDNGDS